MIVLERQDASESSKNSTYLGQAHVDGAVRVLLGRAADRAGVARAVGRWEARWRPFGLVTPPVVKVKPVDRLQKVPATTGASVITQAQHVKSEHARTPSPRVAADTQDAGLSPHGVPQPGRVPQDHLVQEVQYRRRLSLRWSHLAEEGGVAAALGTSTRVSRRQQVLGITRATCQHVNTS